MVRGGYELASGIGFTLDLGYMLLQQTVTGRAGDLTPLGLTPDHGTIDDSLTMRGLLVGGSAYFRTGETWTFTGRLGGGALLGTAKDTRSGTFTPGLGGPPYQVGPLEESPKIVYLYAAPEVAFGRRFGEHFELSLSLRGMFLFGITQPEWRDEQPVLAGNCAPGSTGCEGDAQFGTQKIAGTTVFVLSPGISARAEF